MTSDLNLEKVRAERYRLLERLMAIARIVSVSDLPLGDKREILALCTGRDLQGQKASEEFIEPVTAARFKRLMDKGIGTVYHHLTILLSACSQSS